MQMQKLIQKEEREEHEILLQGTVRAIKEARLEVCSVTAVVQEQGELIEGIDRKITEAENILRRSSRKLSGLIRTARKRRIVSVCLLALTTLSILALFGTALFRG
ncbi:hypothetical protein NEDG_00419 [Nematocida displodere]|uniref:t-SNARE coiled-coil homology domain-containing protein n=1 Tax=Nematocida displodere TaxID=1805483 RepID=A0A177EIZ3_9MICR|nr:hypothetical protein NEDG_00419 [Nematocida displodere]